MGGAGATAGEADGARGRPAPRGARPQHCAQQTHLQRRRLQVLPLPAKASCSPEWVFLTTPPSQPLISQIHEIPKGARCTCASFGLNVMAVRSLVMLQGLQLQHQVHSHATQILEVLDGARAFECLASGCRDEHPSNGQVFLMLAKSDGGLKPEPDSNGSPDSAQQQQQDPEKAQASDAEASLPNGHAPAAVKQGKPSESTGESYTHGLES